MNADKKKQALIDLQNAENAMREAAKSLKSLGYTDISEHSKELLGAAAMVKSWRRDLARESARICAKCEYFDGY